MSKTKTALLAAIVGIIYPGYQMVTNIAIQGEGFGDIAAGLGWMFIGLIVIPIIFGVLGYALAKEKKFVNAFSSLGISFLVILAIMLIAGQYRNAEREKLYPPTEVPTLAPDSPSRKVPQIP